MRDRGIFLVQKIIVDDHLGLDGGLTTVCYS